MKYTWQRKLMLIVALAIGAWAVMGADGCGCEEAKDQATIAETNQVEEQQAIYNKNQPIPMYDFSLPRQLWIDFYDSQNQVVSTWTADCGVNGEPVFITPSLGFPTPRDTQLTNPLRVIHLYQGGTTVEQSEPNGLFTSKNTTATIVMCTNSDGTVSPFYTEGHARCWTFPVEWDASKHMFVRIEGQQPTIKLTPKQGKDKNITTPVSEPVTKK